MRRGKNRSHRPQPVEGNQRNALQARTETARTLIINYYSGISKKEKVNARHNEVSASDVDVYALNAEIERLNKMIGRLKCDVSNISNQFTEVLYFLVNVCAADVNALDSEGLTALMVASKSGLTAFVSHLLEISADVHQKSNIGRTALFEAAENDALETMKVLAEHGADCNICDHEGTTVLMLAAGNGKTEIVRWLFDQNISKNACNNSKDTALILACKNNHVEVIRLLLENGADVRAQNEEQLTALMVASQNGLIGAVSLLLMFTPEQQLEVRGVGGETALMLAAKRGEMATTLMLLECGADVWACNSQGFTAKYLANWQGQSKIEDLLTNWERNNPRKIRQSPAKDVNQKMNIAQLLVETNLEHYDEFFTDVLEMELAQEFSLLSTKRWNRIEKQLDASELDCLLKALQMMGISICYQAPGPTKMQLPSAQKSINDGPA